jgi:microcystin degradation protein MlrC
LFAARRELIKNLPDAATAVAQAIRSTSHPVILVEFGDNIGGGSPGDSTITLRELVEQGAPGAVAVIYDPTSVTQAAAAGIGEIIELSVGGKTDDLHGGPVPIRARVLSTHGGDWIEDQPRHGGRRSNSQGRTAVLQVVDSGSPSMAKDQKGRTAFDLTLVLNSKRTPPFSLGQLTSLGIDPRQKKIVLVKAAIAYRAAYGPIAGEIIEVDTPGLTANDLRRFTYRRARRPIFPLDDI